MQIRPPVGQLHSIMIQRVIALPIAVLIMASCSGGSSPSKPLATKSPDVSSSAATFEVVVEGLIQPTQFLTLSDGRFLVAQLNGDENASLGQVIVVDPGTKKKSILIERLDKPTGLAYINGVIWVMVRRGLVQAKWDETTSSVGPTEIALSDLPFNGRSEGTLTPLSDGRILYETSGDNEAGTVTEGSGQLNAYDPATKTSTIIAASLKNAYVHTVLEDDRILTTEVSAENSNPPPDELNIIDLTTVTTEKHPYFGWPLCPSTKPTEGPCSTVTRPVVTLPDNATPTGIATIGSTAYVALWVSGEIRKVNIDNAQPQTTVVFEGFENPQHLVKETDTTLLLSEHGTGRILRLKLLG